jgi:iron complex transport system permease protein
VFAFSHGDLARRQGMAALDASPRLLLTGVILASGWTAIITVMLTVAPEAKLRGQDLAHALGVRVVMLRRTILVIASLATAIAVTTAGAIGNDQRVLLPACALAGGTLRASRLTGPYVFRRFCAPGFAMAGPIFLEHVGRLAMDCDSSLRG